MVPNNNFYFHRSGDPRDIVGYHDLDAPDDADRF